MNIAERHDHEFPPLIFPDSEILILGSFPSVASRAQKFFYGYPMNRFWGMLAAVYQEDKPNSIEEKTAFCKKHRLALYDVIESCVIVGSSDSSIKDIVFADIFGLCKQTGIKKILLNGKTAGKAFQKYLAALDNPSGFPEFVVLPSTSPANAACSMDKLVEAWRAVLIDFATFK